MTEYDIIIIGAGAAGLSAARGALSLGKTVLVLDMGDQPARKVFVSGGGRCNFTNMAATYERYVGQNPEFTRSALAQVKPIDILDWARTNAIEWVEKAPGQFFCATGSETVVNALLTDAADANIITNTQITNIEKTTDGFTVYAKNSVYNGKQVIIATGGISFPTLTVSDFGYVIAKKFGHKIIPIEPGLVGLKTTAFPTDLSGLSLPVKITVNKKTISDSLLFTHFGIGGPAAYRASLFNLSNDIHIDFLPGTNAYEWLTKSKQTDGRKTLVTLLSARIPSRFAKWLCGDNGKNIADERDADLAVIAKKINDFVLPSGTVKRRGLDSAEVVMGGVSTESVSSKTMESKLCPGLYFAGEVLDIAGDLGGFNLHWAFASGFVAGISAAKN